MLGLSEVISNEKMNAWWSPQADLLRTQVSILELDYFYTRILVKHKGEFDVKCIACFQEDVNIVKIRIKSHETVCAFLKIQMILSQFFFPFFLAKKYNQFLKTIGSEILKCL